MNQTGLPSTADTKYYVLFCRLLCVGCSVWVDAGLGGDDEVGWVVASRWGLTASEEVKFFTYVQL